MFIAGVDPGNKISHCVIWNGTQVTPAVSLPNNDMRHHLMMFMGVVVIEYLTPSAPRAILKENKKTGLPQAFAVALCAPTIIDERKAPDFIGGVKEWVW